MKIVTICNRVYYGMRCARRNAKTVIPRMNLRDPVFY